MEFTPYVLFAGVIVVIILIVQNHRGKRPVEDEYPCELQYDHAQITLHERAYEFIRRAVVSNPLSENGETPMRAFSMPNNGGASSTIVQMGEFHPIVQFSIRMDQTGHELHVHYAAYGGDYEASLNQFEMFLKHRVLEHIENYSV